ncbi:MAG: hypothetical protein ACC682_17285, partial [Gemmatimonadota bacterium]
LSADAWLASRGEARQAEEQLVALARDFEQMAQRADSSYNNAARAVAAGTTLLEQLTGPQPETAADSGMARIRDAMFYEVFSPSTGSYDALVASGSIELIDDEALKTELADFFGSFDDMRVSEGILLSTQEGVMSSETYARLVGTHRDLPEIGRATDDVSPKQAISWAESDVLLNHLAHVLVRQRDVLTDYRYIRGAIDRIQGMLRVLREQA